MFRIWTLSNRYIWWTNTSVKCYCTWMFQVFWVLWCLVHDTHSKCVSSTPIYTPLCSCQVQLRRTVDPNQMLLVIEYQPLLSILEIPSQNVTVLCVLKPSYTWYCTTPSTMCFIPLSEILTNMIRDMSLCGHILLIWNQTIFYKMDIHGVSLSPWGKYQFLGALSVAKGNLRPSSAQMLLAFALRSCFWPHIIGWSHNSLGKRLKLLPLFHHDPSNSWHHQLPERFASQCHAVTLKDTASWRKKETQPAHYGYGSQSLT